MSEEQREIKDRFIKLSGSCLCPMPLRTDKRYIVAMELGIKGIEQEPNEDGTWDEIYKTLPIGNATIQNPEGKRATIKVVGSPSQKFRFHLQQIWEQKGLESSVDFETWYKQIYNKLYFHIERIIDTKSEA